MDHKEPKLIMRHADDDLRAYVTAEAMEQAGATIISIVFVPLHNRDPRVEMRSVPVQGFHIFARLNPVNGATVDAIDAAIDAAFERLEARKEKGNG